MGEKVGISENRKTILQLLAARGHTWKELKEKTGLSDPVLAKHIKALLKGGLITEEVSEKDRRVKIYRIKGSGIEYMGAWIRGLYFYKVLQEDLLQEASDAGLDADKLAKIIGQLFIIASYKRQRALKTYLTAVELFGFGLHSILASLDIIDRRALDEIELFDEIEKKDPKDLLNEIKQWFGELALETKALEEGFKSGEIEKEIKAIVKSEKKREMFLKTLKQITRIRMDFLNSILELPHPAGEVLKDLINSYINESRESLKQKRHQLIKEIENLKPIF